MEPEVLPTDLILMESGQKVGQVVLADRLQPGTWLTFGGKTYTVLERRHRYQLQRGHYHLCKMTLFLALSPTLDEVSQVDERLVLGNPGCDYNAHSELIRCAVHPFGPCQGCPDFRPRLAEVAD